MQLAVVLETELELYLHINILIAGRILKKKPRADRERVQNNGRIIVSLLCCLFLAQICKCCDIPPVLQCLSGSCATFYKNASFKAHLSLDNNKGHKNSDNKKKLYIYIKKKVIKSQFPVQQVGVCFLFCTCKKPITGGTFVICIQEEKYNCAAQEHRAVAGTGRE